MSSLRLFRCCDAWRPAPDADRQPWAGARARREPVSTPRPRQARARAATAQPCVPRPLRRVDAPPQTAHVAADADVIAVASHAWTARGVLGLDRWGPRATPPVVEGRLGPSAARPPCRAAHPPSTLPGPRPRAREAPKVEGGRTGPPLLPLRRTPQGPAPRLVRWRARPKRPRRFSRPAPPPSGLVFALKANEAGVRPIPAQGRCPPQPRLARGLAPPGEHLVPRDVAQERCNHRPLSGPQLWLHHRLAVTSPHVHALINASPQRPICDPHCEHLLERGAIQAVEEGPDGPPQYPLQRAPVHDLIEDPYGVMGTASGPHPRRAVQHVWFVRELRVPHARRLGPAWPRPPTSPSAASSLPPGGWGPVGSVEGGPAAPAAVRAAPGDGLPVPARLAPS